MGSMAWQVKGMGGHATNLPNAENPFAAKGGDAGVSAVFGHDFRYAVNGCFSHILPGRPPAVTFPLGSLPSLASAPALTGAMRSFHQLGR